MNKKVSVCMPTYNGELYIKDQLDSILMQLEENDEVIISDDSSTDSTIDIIKSINDKRIMLPENNKFFSPIFNLENALLKASGDYIFLSDQDDIWMEDKVKSFIVELENYDLIISDATIVNENMNIIQDSFFGKKKPNKNYIKNLIKNPYLGCCMAFRKDLLSKVLPFPSRIAMHDIWIGWIAELSGNTYFLDKKLLYYRRHGNNASATSEKSNRKIIDRVLYRLNLLKLLFIRLNINKIKGRFK